MAVNSLFWNNYDLPRAISRFGDDSPAYRELSGKMLAIYLHFMSGTPYIYQGEEIGMVNYPITDISQADDIETRNMYKERLEAGFSKEEILSSINAKGRDNARRPMQWSKGKGAGFTEGRPWLAIHENHQLINADEALKNPNSIFYTYQKLIALRKEYPVMAEGSYQALETGNPHVLAYRKFDEEDEFTVIVNFTKEMQNYTLDVKGDIFLYNYPEVTDQHHHTPRPYEAFVFKK